MQMGRRRDRDSIDTLRKQRLNAAERRTAERARNEIALLAIGIGHADEPDARQIGEDAGMIAAHHADAHYTYAQQTVGVAFGGLHHDGRVPPPGSRNESLLARPKAAGDGPVRGCGHVLNQRVTSTALISNPSMPSLWAEPEKPIDEAANPLLDRSLGPEPHGALEVGCIPIGLRDVAGLHRKQLPTRWLADGLLDQPHDLGHLDRVAIADVVDVPRCLARGGIGSIR